MAVLKEHGDSCLSGSALPLSELQTFLSSELSIFLKQNSVSFT